MVPDSEFRAVMESFWRAGVHKVSPGAFGMVLRGHPFIKSELLRVVAQNPWVRWDGDWIVKREVC